MEMKLFDILKYDKENAMERFNMLQRMKKLLKVFETVFVLTLLYWSTKKIRSAVQFSPKLFELPVSFLNPHFVFLIRNAIILAVFLLCKQNGPGNSSGPGDLYETYSRNSMTSPEVETKVAEQNVKLENKKSKIPGGHKEVDILSSSSRPQKVQCEAVEVAIETAEQEIRRFERTLSEKLKREIAVRPRKDLRRTETENGREGRVVRPSIKTVEHLNNEEFKLAIDAFIDKHRVFSKERIIS